MRFFAKVTGRELVRKNLKKFQKLAISEQVAAIQDATFLVHEKAVKSIQDNSGGKPDIRYNPRRGVVVSKPGKPPNTDTGRLVQSIQVEFRNNGLEGIVGTNLKYGVWLEFGTQDMPARPWLKPAVQSQLKKINSRFSKAVERSIKKGAKK